MIPDAFKQELLARTNIVDVVSRFVEIKKQGIDHYGKCPFHDEDGPSFSVSERKQFFYCFGCGRSGDAITFLMDYQGDGFRAAVKELAVAAGMQLPDLGPTVPEKVKAEQDNRAAREILSLMEHELIIAVIAVSDARKGKQITDVDHKRFLLSIERLMTAIEASKRRPLTAEEREHILGEEKQQEKEAA